ncbi:methyltransferase domain-containing protein [Streptomyces sp. NPDC047028]|uniref:glutamine amidotransferase-related protein n=1 Tax=Streptomyces sp. NPDC047028 TaxID=3155793 RepID=UPI0033E7B810
MSTAQAAHVLVLELTAPEGPYAVATALETAGLPVRVCRPWAGDDVPDTLADVVALVAMGGPMAAYDDFPGRTAELALLRAALEAEVPLLGVRLGAQLLASAAGGTVHVGDDAPIGWGEVRTSRAAHTDPLFADTPERLRVLHRHTDTMELPPGAILLATSDGGPVQAFRIGGSAWGPRFHLEADKSAVDALAAEFPDDAATAPGLVESAPTEPAEQAPHRDRVFARFAALVVERSARTATRTFFTPRATAWEERIAADNPMYAAAVARMGLRPGQCALDVGCGSGRALPALHTSVGDQGVVLGADLTQAMLTATVREGRARLARLLLADACRLPLPAGAVHPAVACPALTP